ncbi:ABC transporter ATP-binding protein [Agrococcus jejuensis]|uniref:Energy-coupling factor transport system ATP-binding protein n=1 Tax=Agrococcus jejuensis TaxID=399736 RepID=A0A1G8GMR5_9MICO|nr:ABC transporter ATP-binding protein [Agrococcus jejuensis]SDH95663.1 energy-coupling factor transport system ATP-binding protein [Agrococcus jejuensis]
MTAASIRADGWGWRHAARTRPAVAGLSFSVEPGERVLLLGPSGAGKSTLLAGLAGVLGDAEDGEESGSLAVDGAHPATTRGTAGLVLQDPQANTILSRVGDDVAFGAENLRVPRDEIWTRVREALDAVGLAVDLERSTAALSGGQRQRLALAGILAMRPGLVLLDEPTANLDPEGVVEVRDAVVRMLDATGATLVVVEHRVDTWLPVVDRVVVLDPGGGVLADGPADAVFARHGDALAECGVWVPGHPVSVERREVAAGDELLRASGLVVGRDAPVRPPVDLALAAGTSTVVTGPNGAGKSTLALTMASLLPRLGGTLAASPTLAGGLSPDPGRWRSSALATRIGTVFQEPEHQLVGRTVREELGIGLRAVGVPRAVHAARIDALLQRLRLDHLADAHPFTLSGGEQRRLSVATVLATGPRVVVLDEPTFGQDRRTWRELVTLMADLVADGAALLSVTHDADVVRVLGTSTSTDRVVGLDAA